MDMFNISRELNAAISKGNFSIISSMIEIGMITAENAIQDSFEFYKSGYIDPTLIEHLLRTYRKQAKHWMSKGKIKTLQVTVWSDYIDEGFRSCYKEIAGISIQKELNISHPIVAKEEPFKHMFLWSCFRMDKKCSQAFMLELQYPMMAGIFAYRVWTMYIADQQKNSKAFLVHLNTWKDYAR